MFKIRLTKKGLLTFDLFAWTEKAKAMDCQTKQQKEKKNGVKCSASNGHLSVIGQQSWRAVKTTIKVIMASARTNKSRSEIDARRTK